MLPPPEVEIPVKPPSTAPPMVTPCDGESKNAPPDCDRADKFATETRIGLLSVPIPPPCPAPFTSSAAEFAEINAVASCANDAAPVSRALVDDDDISSRCEIRQRDIPARVGCRPGVDSEGDVSRSRRRSSYPPPW